MFIIDSGASQLAVVVKNPPANAGRLKRCWIPSLDWEDPLEEGMKTHPTILAWRISWTEPGRLQSIGSQSWTRLKWLSMHACWWRRHKRCGLDAWVVKIPWSRAWQPIPVFLPGESLGQRNLAGYSPQGRNELNMTEVTCTIDNG